jgi:hypothetical protein
LSHIEPHDEFLELCAVSTSGQLTEDEQKRLDEHLAICSICRDALKQYEAIAAHAIPAIAAEDAADDVEPGPAWSQRRAEASLFNQIAQEEHSQNTLSWEKQRDPLNSASPVFPFAAGSTWRNVWTLFAAGILLAAALGICLYQVGMRRGVDTAKLTLPQADQRNEVSLEAQVSDAAHQRELVLTQLSERDREIAELRKHLERQSADLTRLKDVQEQSAADHRNDDAAEQELMRREAHAKEKLEMAEANSHELQAKLDSLTKQSAEDQSRAGQLMAQVKELTQALHDRDASLDQKDELLAKDRDIRELMGARELYVAEVYDVNRTGETRKPYGRVFYTRGKSLIFYAYDLDQEPEIKNASTFQAWGQRGPDRQQALSLGIFYEDNASKKRWVLKLDDPKALAQLDAVFVTVEPRGGSHKPSGKPLLFAYLKTDPNHP